MTKTIRGMALPITLFFVMVAFFAASALLTRVHYEAKASSFETTSIQREALARSALTTLIAKLNQAATEEGVTPVTLTGPGGFKATTWIEKEGDSLFRLYAKVDGGMGKPYVAQKVVRKKPVLTPIDVAHLSDGSLHTSDQLKFRATNAKKWTLLPSPKGAVMGVEVDRRGNIFANYFPVLAGKLDSTLPKDFITNFVRRNDQLVREGNVGHDFLKSASQAIEENWELDLNETQSTGITNSAGASQNSSFAASQSSAARNPELVQNTHTVADAIAGGATLQHYSSETGEWNTIGFGLPKGVTGQVPGYSTSDGDNLYVPILKPGPDRLRKYNLKRKSWTDVPTPPALSRNGGKLAYGKGKTHQLVDIEVDDDGRIYAHHGDGQEYGLSRYDPDSQEWQRLPNPPGKYVDLEGKNNLLMVEAKAWGDMEVDEQGDIYVVWRAKQEPEVAQYLQSKGPQVGSGGTSVGVPGSGVPVTATGKPGKTGKIAGIAPPPPGKNVFAPGKDSTNSKKTSGGLASNAPPSMTTDVTPPQSGFGNFGGGLYEPAQDVILRFRKGRWETVTLKGGQLYHLGRISAGIDGRLIVNDLRPRGPDMMFSLGSDGHLDAPTSVPGLEGEPAEYFSADSGARPVTDRFEFRETAEF
jgi:hypothetical protein